MLHAFVYNTLNQTKNEDWIPNYQSKTLLDDFLDFLIVWQVQWNNKTLKSNQIYSMSISKMTVHKNFNFHIKYSTNNLLLSTIFTMSKTWLINKYVPFIRLYWEQGGTRLLDSFSNYLNVFIFIFIIYFFRGLCFSNPFSPHRSPINSVPCVPFYTLSSPAFKGVTSGMSYFFLC